MLSSNFVTAAVLALASCSRGATLPCVADKFAALKAPGTEILDVTAEEVRDYDQWSKELTVSAQVEHRSIDFCNVTVTYTHSGWNDTVHVYIWLPLEDWNGRFFGQGGGGWSAGNPGALAAPVAMGYSAANTDAAHDFWDPISGATSAGWAFAGKGNINLPLLYDFAYVSLNDMTILAKEVTKSFYGKVPAYSYWNGCSTGGRQGMVQAQRFPTNYDGILSAAPAMNWVSFVTSEIWGQVLMHEKGVYPPPCEFKAITSAATAACDDLDGVKDGLVSAPGLCNFDALSLVGKEIECHGISHTISKAAVEIAIEVWQGPNDSEGTPGWFGLPHEVSFGIEEFGPFGGLVMTSCNDEQKECQGVPFPITVEWIKLFLLKDPDFDITTLKRENFYDLLHQSRQEYLSVMDTADPDLSAFRKAGGKMVHWHGIADQLIYVNGSSNYYERVKALDSNVADFYRYFEFPGVTHCFGGIGPYPVSAFESLVNWVENGKAPDYLEGKTGPPHGPEKPMHRPLCAYPQVAAYKGGDINIASSFECADSFEAFGPPGQEGRPLHDEL